MGWAGGGGGQASLPPSRPDRATGQGRGSAPFSLSKCRLTPGGPGSGNSSSQDSPVPATQMTSRTHGGRGGTRAADGREALWGSPSPSSPGGRRRNRRRLGLRSPLLGAEPLPALLSLLPPGPGRPASLNFNRCCDSAGARQELIREPGRGSSDRSTVQGSWDSAAPAPSRGSESPQVASGRGGESLL